MSSPINLIREGIENADWSMVCEGFSLMTGDEISVPKQSQNAINDVTLTINGKTFYQFDWSKDKPTFHNYDEEPKEKSDDRPFVEAEEDFEEVEDEVSGGIFSTSRKESKALSKARAGVVRETRPKYTPLKLTCAGCNNVFDVHPSLKPVKLADDEEAPPYRCDSCAVRKRFN